MPSVAQSSPAVKGTRLTVLQVLAVAVATEHCQVVEQVLRKPLLECLEELIQIVLGFVAASPTPQGMWEFERNVADLLRRVGCLVLQCAVNQLEPEDACQVPSRLWRGSEEFSRKRHKSLHRAGVACLFGMIELWRWSYEPLSEEREAGLRSIAPLVEQLGIVGDKATPALAEVIGRLAQERSESSVGEFLKREHDVQLCTRRCARSEMQWPRGSRSTCQDNRSDCCWRRSERARGTDRSSFRWAAMGFSFPCGECRTTAGKRRPSAP